MNLKPLFYSLFLLFTISFFLYKYHQNRKIKKEKYKVLQLEAKLRTITHKINPHFLFNTLNAIIGLGYANDHQQLEKLVQNLSEMYRRILYLPSDSLIPLAEELALVKNYLEIEKIRFNQHFEFSVAIENSLLLMQIIPLTVVTMVEKLVNEKISQKNNSGKIHITIFKHQKDLHITIQDTHFSLNPTLHSWVSSIAGLEETLRLFYKNNTQIYIKTTAEKSVLLTIIIPAP